MRTHRSTHSVARCLLSLAIAAAIPAMASAGPTWTEIGDAGDLPGDAQVTVGAGPLESILGQFSGIDDIDLFAIRITNPAAFSATTVSLNTEFLDTQLFLFDANGRGVVANDDDINDLVTLNATIPVGEVTNPGLYFLAVSEFGDDPLSSSGMIFPVRDFFIPPLLTDVVGPTGDGGADPLVAWNVDGFSESIFPPFPTTYEIVLTGATFAAVPEPGSLALLGTGLASLAGYGWRRRKRALPGDR